MKMACGFLLAIAAILLLIISSISAEFVRRKMILKLTKAMGWMAARALKILRPCCEEILKFVHKEMSAWSNRYAWVVAVLQVFALLVYLSNIFYELSLWGVIFALLTYWLVVCALSISIISKFPIIRACWNDISVKIVIFGSQLVGLFLAKGMANVWLADLWGISAVNMPMAHAVATVFTMLFGLSLLLLPAMFVFEFLFLFSLAAPMNQRSAGKWTEPFVWRSSAIQGKGTTVRKWCWRERLGITLVTVTTLFACGMAINSGPALFRSPVADTFLAAVAYELDAVPAYRCDLRDESDRAAAKKDDPDVKVLFLSSTQERAIILRRAKNLYDPIVLKRFNSNRDAGKGFTVGDVVVCYR